jgi:predicted O-methyltransferase YrrM
MRMAMAYLNHRIHAKRRHGVHSPFVYQLGEKVFYRKDARRSDEIEALRKALMRNEERVKLTDYGAGSRLRKSAERSLAEIAKTSATAPKTAQMLQRLVDHFDFREVIELGTNLGITTAYLAAAKCKPRVRSLEGDPFLADQAALNLKSLELEAEVVSGKFENTLGPTLSDMERVDFAYLDGNHREAATLDYFEAIMNKIRETSVVAIGDIHWSEEMESAWKSIISDERVTLSIDLFDLGLTFFRRNRMEREHFILRL